MKKGWQLIVQEQSKSPVSEAYRILRTNINYCKSDGELKTMMFTSAGPREGKSLTVANMAVALAQSGKKVIVVDCDLRQPVQHKIFNLKRNAGVTNILAAGNECVEDYIQESGIPNLLVIASGPLPPNPSELLGSNKMHKLIAYLKESADYAIFDVPPVIAVADACVLAARLDGVIMVLDSDTIRPEMAKMAKEMIVKARGIILGVVLNRVEIEGTHYYYYDFSSDQKVVGQ